MLYNINVRLLAGLFVLVAMDVEFYTLDVSARLVDTGLKDANNGEGRQAFLCRTRSREF